MRYTYKGLTELDERSKFANKVCKLLVNKYRGNAEVATHFLTPIYDDFEEHVRNIYELIDTEIPLFALYELLREDAKDNFGLTDEELSKAIQDTKDACKKYYL